MRKLKYLLYFFVGLLFLQACSLLSPDAPKVNYRAFKNIKDYQAYQMTDLEKMLSDIFKKQGLTGKIQVADISANFPQNEGYTAYFIYTELVDGELIAQSSMIDVTPDFTGLYYPEELPQKVLSASELDESSLFGFLLYSAWEGEKAKTLLDEAKANFVFLEELGLTDISANGSFVSDLSPRYYETVTENQGTKAKKAFAGFYDIDMINAMSKGDAKITIHGLWKTDDSDSEQEEDLLEDLILSVQRMDHSDLPDGQYSLSYTHQVDTTYFNGIHNGFDFEVKSGQLVNFYVEPIGQYWVDREEDRAVPSQELQDRIIRDFLSSYAEVTSIEVVEAQTITREVANVTKNEITFLTLKVNGYFFIQYQYDYDKDNDTGTGDILRQYSRQVFVYEPVKLDDPILDQRVAAAKIIHLTAEQ